MSRKKSDNLFSASDVGQYTFCSVSWFLKRQGYQELSSKKLLKKKSHGLKVHETIGRKTYLNRVILRLGYYLFFIGIFILLLILIGSYFGLIW
jgi:hypothetical protein